MTYKATRIDNQSLTFSVTTDHNGKEITFNVVCANDESEVPELIAVYLNFLDSPTPSYEQQAPSPDLAAVVQEQQSLIQELTARLEVLENK